MMGEALIPPVLKAKSFSQGHRGEIEKGGVNHEQDYEQKSHIT